MTRIALLLFITTSACVVRLQAQWTNVYDSEILFKHMAYVNDSTVIAAGFETLFHSVTDGELWSAIDSFPGTAFFEDLVHSREGEITIALNGGGAPWLFSIDNGLTWDTIFPLGIPGWAYKLYYNSSGHAIMVSDVSVYFSYDNFQSVTANFLPSFQPLRCGCLIDSLNAAVVNTSAEVFRTSDGGNTWTYETFISGNSASRCDLQFFDSGLGVFIGENTVSVLKPGEAVWTKLIATSDGFEISDASFVSDSVWYLVGRYGLSSQGFALRTVDAGNTWSKGSFNETPSTLFSITCKDTSNCLAASGTNVYKLTNWIATGIQTYELPQQTSFSISPSVSSGMIKVDWSFLDGNQLSTLSLQVCNLSGICNEELSTTNETSATLNLTEYHPGLYLANLTGPDGQIVAMCKFVIAR